MATLPMSSGVSLNAPTRKRKVKEDPIDLDRTVRAAWRTVMDNKQEAILAPILTLAVVLAGIGLVFLPILFFVFLAIRVPASPWLSWFKSLGPDVFFAGYQALISAVGLPLSVWIGLGLVSVFLKLVRGQRPHPQDLFNQHRLVLPAMLAYALSVAIQTAAVAALFIGALIMQVALVFYAYFMIERGLGPVAALQASFQATWSFRTLVKLIAVSLLLQVGIGLTLGVGAIILAPWLLAIFARIYVLLSERVPCLHCGVRSAPRTETCRGCGGAPRTAPEPPEGDKPLALTIPARPRPGWIDWVALALLVPLITQGGNPFGGVIFGATTAPRFLNIHPLVGAGMGLGAVCVPLAGAVWLLVRAHVGLRRVELDDAGGWFGGTENWPGVRVPFRDVKGFWLTGDEAIRLEVEKQPWTRWLGPTIPTQGRGTHDLVVALEARGIYNLAGRS